MSVSSLLESSRDARNDRRASHFPVDCVLTDASLVYLSRRLDTASTVVDKSLSLHGAALVKHPPQAEVSEQGGAHDAASPPPYRWPVEVEGMMEQYDEVAAAGDDWSIAFAQRMQRYYDALDYMRGGGAVKCAANIVDVTEQEAKLEASLLAVDGESAYTDDSNEMYVSAKVALLRACSDPAITRLLRLQMLHRYKHALDLRAAYRRAFGGTHDDSFTREHRQGLNIVGARIDQD